MANGRSKGRRVDPGRDGGGFVALPWAVLDCPAYAALGHPAKALLIELARQLGTDNNGQLLATYARLSPRGWKSHDVIDRALRELVAVGFVYRTVEGRRPNRASWFAVTWYALSPHSDYDAGAEAGFVRGAYRNGNSPTPPAGADENTRPNPSRGVRKATIAPSGGVERPSTTPSNGAMHAT